MGSRPSTSGDASHPSDSRHPSDSSVESWHVRIEQANQHNIFCHCRACGAEWVGSTHRPTCRCGSSDVETIACWQFPDG